MRAKKDEGMYSTEEYKGCRNCKYQPEPMKTCDWIKHEKEVYIVCPMRELKENKGGGVMERLTTNKDVSEMGMFELAHNSCYCKDGVARYRDFENDMDARDLARELAWSLADIELSNDNECFDEEMIENLQYDITQEPIGLIALFYRNLWAMADLREKLKEYEDLEEQGLLLRLPCKVGDTVYFIYHNEVHHEEVKRFFQCNGGKNWGIVLWGMYPDLYFDQIGKTVFLTQAEAEQKLKEMESD